MSRARTSRLLAVLLAAPVCALSACGGGGSGGADPSSTATTSSPATTAATAPATTSSPPGPTSSGGASTGASAATGATLTVPGVTVHLPTRWQAQEQGQLNAAGYDPGGSTAMVYLHSTSAFPSDTLDSLARISARAATAAGHGADRRPDRVVDGVRGYVLSGSSKTFQKYYEYGTITGGNVVQVAFEWRTAPPDAGAVIESVLASVQFE